MDRYLIPAITLLLLLSSCEEVIDVDLNFADPAIVAEATIYKDSVTLVRLTRTSSYFSPDETEIIEDASIILSDGTSSESLNYKGNGYYIGNTILGTEEKNYKIEIIYGGIRYEGKSFMTLNKDIISVSYSKSNSQSIFNPYRDTIFTIECEFIDEPDKDNFYMIRYILDGEILKGSYYLASENNAINGSVEISNANIVDNDTIKFEEWMFYEGGEVEVQVFSIDESVYNYFVQLNDILYWKRRVMPPASYNPASNITNGALGYFAAWAYDSMIIELE